MRVHLRFHDAATRPSPRFQTVVLGRPALLAGVGLAQWLRPIRPSTWDVMVRSLSPGDSGELTCTWVEGPPAIRWFVGALPDVCSRHNTPTRAHVVTALVGSAAGGKEPLQVIVALDDASHARAVGCAIARAFPLYGHRGLSSSGDRPVDIWLLPPSGHGLDLSRVEGAANAVRQAAWLTDLPTNELDVALFVEHARQVAGAIGASIEVVSGEELERAGFGGLWGVGKAAEVGPALVVLKHEPAGAERTVAWVGKGIVYDTGGLSIKQKTGMPGMKRDMAGAAAVLWAFVSAVQGGCPDRLYAILCLAENAVGPKAVRNDDILTMYSGKTVEVNNTDAEGRLVLADGVAYATRHLDPQVVVDLATLTGAQLIATGKRHAGVMADDAAWEARAVEAGRASGDLVHPLPYAPELFRSEFSSKVADLRNSVKDRNNAQSSCAGQFIAEHLGDYAGVWVHIDMAGPSESGGRATGYGVALLLEMFGY